MAYGANTIRFHDFHNVNKNMTSGCKYEVSNRNGNSTCLTCTTQVQML